VPPRDLEGIPPLPGGLENIILTCLEKKPEHRYQSVPALRADLNRIMAGENTASLDLRPTAGRRSSRLGYLLGAAIGGVVLAAAAVFLLWPDSRPVVKPGVTGPTAGVVVPTGPAARPGPATADKGQMEFSFRSDPPGASVFASDGTGPLGQTPFSQKRPAADRERAFVFKLAGYRDQSARPTADPTPEVFALLETETGTPRAHDPRPRPRQPDRTDKPPPVPAPTGAPTGPRPTPSPTGKKRIDRVDTVDPFAE
jgi:hypothetical protein